MVGAVVAVGGSGARRVAAAVAPQGAVASVLSVARRWNSDLPRVPKDWDTIAERELRGAPLSSLFHTTPEVSEWV